MLISPPWWRQLRARKPHSVSAPSASAKALAPPGKVGKHGASGELSKDASQLKAETVRLSGCVRDREDAQATWADGRACGCGRNAGGNHWA